jgi:hypothetical protein
VAKAIARRTDRPTYVGNSISLASMGLGGTVEEEMEALARVVEVTMSQLQHLLRDGLAGQQQQQQQQQAPVVDGVRTEAS